MLVPAATFKVDALKAPLKATEVNALLIVTVLAVTAPNVAVPAEPNVRLPVLVKLPTSTLAPEILPDVRPKLKSPVTAPSVISAALVVAEVLIVVFAVRVTALSVTASSVVEILPAKEVLPAV